MEKSCPQCSNIISEDVVTCPHCGSGLPVMPPDFGKKYSTEGFWVKVKQYAFTAGREVIEKALILYYGVTCKKTPEWAKVTIVAALGYFISPFDAIPDVIPGVGYSDDYGVLAMALGAVLATLCKEDIEKAKRLVSLLFGPQAPRFCPDCSKPIPEGNDECPECKP